MQTSGELPDPDMKICFFLQRRFAMIGHAMAVNIKEIAPETEFCALVQSRPSYEFIKRQKEIAYTSIINGEDIYRTLRDVEIDKEFLASFERDYGIPNLWPYLYIDRVVMYGQFLREYPHDRPTLSHEDMQRCLQVNAKAILEFLDREKPDAVVISVIGTVASALLYHVAQKRGIRVINIEFARIGNRIVFSEDDRTFTWVKKRFDEIRGGAKSPMREAAERFLQEFREAPAPYDADYMKDFYAKKDRTTELRFLSPKKLAKSIPWHVKALRDDLKKRKNQDYIDQFVWWATWDKLKRKGRSFVGYDDLYSVPDWNVRFAYYPLHIEPEIAILRYAPYHTDQIALIKAIAHALPIDMMLYVKEHPGMVGYRTRKYYKDIVKIPNVKLVSPNVPGGELSKRAAITTTITSTAGWEALLCEKPALTFGDTFYNDIPGVEHCDSFERLPFQIKRALEEWKSDDGVLVDYISALLEDSVEVNFQGMWNEATPVDEVKNDLGMKELSRLLGKKAGIAA